MKIEFSRQIFEKFSTVKFNENPSSGNCGRTEAQTDGHNKAVVAFRNFSNVPKSFAFPTQNSIGFTERTATIIAKRKKRTGLVEE
jgi:hypothetical protein